MDIIIYIVLAFLCGIVLVLCSVLWMSHQRNDDVRSHKEGELRNQRMMEEVSQRISKELLQFQTMMHQSMQNDLSILREDTSKHLFSMEKNMNESINYQLETTGKVFTSMMGEMTKINEAQKHLQELSYHIHDLEKIFNDKKTRGIFGEIELYSLLENVMGDHMQRYGKQVKLSNGTIVDAVLYGGKAMPMICIDSKFPLENYQRLLDTSLIKEEQRKAQIQFFNDVKKHIKAIADKYIIPHETAEFAYLFLPAESLFSYLHANGEEVVRYAYEQHVYLVSPTTLMAYITAMKAMYLNQQRNEHMLEIQGELKKLAVEFERFEKRYQAMSNDFEKCYSDMRQVSITAGKLVHRFQEIQDVDLHPEES